MVINTGDQEKLLLEISHKLKKEMTIYAIGGTAMMLYNMKGVTKDIDFIFLNEKDRMEFKRILESLNYKSYNSTIVYGFKKNHPIMLARGEGKEERFDLFTTEVINLIFSNSMIKRAVDTHVFDRNLILKLADPHDLILMKCATDRAKDKEDIMLILAKATIDWDIIIGEALVQISLGNELAAFELGEFLEKLNHNGAVKVPKEVLDKLFEIVEAQSQYKRKELKG